MQPVLNSQNHPSRFATRFEWMLDLEAQHGHLKNSIENIVDLIQ